MLIGFRNAGRQACAQGPQEYTRWSSFLFEERSQERVGCIVGLPFEGAFGPRILENCIVRVHLKGNRQILTE
jgi:hypothetical protein